MCTFVCIHVCLLYVFFPLFICACAHRGSDDAPGRADHLNGKSALDNVPINRLTVEGRVRLVVDAKQNKGRTNTQKRPVPVAKVKEGRVSRSVQNFFGH